jgi:predicted transcriptional regulator
MTDVAAGSVNNAMTELREAGHVQPAGGRGTYQLTQ